MIYLEREVMLESVFDEDHDLNFVELLEAQFGDIVRHDSELDDVLKQCQSSKAVLNRHRMAKINAVNAFQGRPERAKTPKEKKFTQRTNHCKTQRFGQNS